MMNKLFRASINKTSPHMGMVVSAKTTSLKNGKLRQKIQSQNK